MSLGGFMRLSIKPIKNFSNINNFSYQTEWIVRSGEPNRLYFQLVDLDQDSLRHMPTDSIYSVTVTFPAVNPANIVTRSATQADTLDRSVWYVDLVSTDTIYTGNVQFSVVEGTTTRTFFFLQGLVVEYLNEGGC